MVSNIPLMVVPLIVFNLVIGGFAGVSGPDPWAMELYSTPMLSGGIWTMTLGDLMIVLSLALLFFEIMKSTRTSNASVIDHLLSTFVFVAFLVEFLLVPAASHALFFILLVMAFFDILAGFAVSLRSAGRDVNFR
ncbi:hypothetical protein M8997_010115 [Phyllobacterium sp. 21LDTY02-6]|jgi:hypothetical protein|uniref:hypothetical protein n=1 Tax=unclassified Phyllobacterium TaxID=2638441 RepID=UPI00201FD080|nr:MULTISPECIES: hypothetical protein [unclassified Phyllobacterium]MCO4317538.1 hypothetical protein [Phyllobacterium sp. 21LDTY02-6]MCX8293085.1 hypothetical protein [Phyllobacterium sp. 0TCS1.6A]